MVPPKLRLVSSEGEDEAIDSNAPEAQEAIELARALGEVEAAESGEFVPQQAAAAPPVADLSEDVRIVEALLFASPAPLAEEWLAKNLRHGSDIGAVLATLKAAYASRGVNLVRIAGKWVFRTAEDLGFLLERYAVEERRLSRAALETLAIIAYHQPVTRAEIEDIRGVTTSAGTLDILMEGGWVRPRGRRRAPGKPLTYGTTESFLAHFGLDSVKDLPGLADLKAQGLLDGHLPPGFSVPDPSLVAALMPDELPLEDAADEEAEASSEADDAEPALSDEAHGDDGASDDIVGDVRDDTDADTEADDETAETEGDDVDALSDRDLPDDEGAGKA